MSKKGTTLIESVIAIFLISVVLVTFLEALNVGITGTLQLSRKTSALSLAKSQIEYVKSVTYNASAGNLSTIYGVITTINASNISDTVNYAISGQVSNVSTNQSLQQITVNVSYLHGKEVQLTAYKAADGSSIEPPARGLLVTDNIKTVPTLPAGTVSWSCANAYRGYYHIFTTGTTGPISATWKFKWSRTSGLSSMGAPMIAIYEGVPVWANRDYLGVVREDGIVLRPQTNTLFSIGDLPGPGDNSICNCLDPSGCETNCSGEENPIIYLPHMGDNLCYVIWFYSGTYPCCGAVWDGDVFWTYDNPLDPSPPYPSDPNLYQERTLTTTNMSPATYTIFFFNGENLINLDTISASVTYWY